MQDPATVALFRALGRQRPAELPEVTLCAAVLAGVREHRPGERPARTLGPPSLEAIEKAAMKPLRFRRLIEAETPEDRLTALRRAVQLADRRTQHPRAGRRLPRLVGDPAAALDIRVLQRRLCRAGARTTRRRGRRRMSRFLQLHLLTFYPPSNLNRDDTGRPKTATVGGAPRLRISSQALKRAWRANWRECDAFVAIRGYLGDRTQRIGRDVANLARDEFGFTEPEANAVGLLAASVFGKLDTAPKPGQELFTKQLAFVARDERDKLRSLLDRIASDPGFKAQLVKIAGEFALDASEDDQGAGRQDKRKQSKTTTKLINDVRNETLTLVNSSIDVAMFGRMLADSPKFNREAAVQVAHAITTHRVTVEDDYYTAIDDLKTPEEDAGAGFVGELGFGSGIFYLYACVDTGLLIKDLAGEKALAADACAALAEAAATVSPKGKQPSFAARARAHYVLAEAGGVQPRTLAGAFVQPVRGDDLAAASITALEDWRAKLDHAYGPAAEVAATMNVATQQGTLAEIVAFCRDAAGDA